MTYNYFDSPLERICRRARERDEDIIAHPERYTRDEVDAAKLSIYQRERLSVASILRYDD